MHQRVEQVKYPCPIADLCGSALINLLHDNRAKRASGPLRYREYVVRKKRRLSEGKRTGGRVGLAAVRRKMIGVVEECRRG